MSEEQDHHCRMLQLGEAMALEIERTAQVATLHKLSPEQTEKEKAGQDGKGKRAGSRGTSKAEEGQGEGHSQRAREGDKKHNLHQPVAIHRS